MMEATGSQTFVATQWSLVIAARNSEGAASRAAMEELAQRYWYPLYAYIRRKGNSPSDAEDLTQEFFRLFLEKRFLSHIDPAKGRFRAFLLACVNHFLSHERERVSAKKRGGDRIIMGLEAAESRYVMEARSETPERLFEKRWALQMLETVMVRLEREYGDRKELFGGLKGVLTTPGDSSYAGIGRKLGMTEGSVRTAVHRLRARYRAILKEEIAQTVTTDGAIAEEIQYLMGCL
jgi:RNA polymerase sigma factor (sigma-70 family)